MSLIACTTIDSNNTDPDDAESTWGKLSARVQKFEQMRKQHEYYFESLFDNTEKLSAPTRTS